MALAVSQNAYPKGLARLQNVTAVFGTIVASGSYATGGDAFALPELPGYDSTQIVDVFIHGIAGYQYKFDVATSKVLVFETGAALSGALAELGAGAYPAGITGDTISYVAYILNHG